MKPRPILTLHEYREAVDALTFLIGGLKEADFNPSKLLQN